MTELELISGKPKIFAIISDEESLSLLKEFVEDYDYEYAGSAFEKDDIFDKLENIEAGVGGEIQLTDAINEQENVYATTFEGTIYDIGNTMEWLKSSIDMALTHDDARDEIIDYIKQKLEEI